MIITIVGGWLQARRESRENVKAAMEWTVGIMPPGIRGFWNGRILTREAKPMSSLSTD
jgi:hypothetical protein